MDVLADLGRLLGFSFAAGVNLYATVALLGLASRFGWVALPPQYQAFDHDLIIYAAIALYAIEFLADKVPWVDTIWDTVHSFIRPIGGAAIAVIALGPSSPTLTAASALLGALVAGSSHVTKAGTRVIVNTSPEPFSNWALSLGEDAMVAGLAFVAMRYPVAALAITAALLVLMVAFAAAIVRAFRRRFGRRTRASLRAASGAACVVLIAAAAAGLAAQQGGERPGAAQRPAAAGTPQPAQGGQAAPPQPVFRAGANFVRVDAYATKDGQAVTDLTADDFEVYEDGVLQKIETFEHVVVQSTRAPAARVEPRNVQESRQMVADPRSRVFVIFLDKWHMRMGSGYNVRPPLVRMLERVIGDDDLAAIMTPDMSALDLQFTRRTDVLAARLQSESLLTLGLRDRVKSGDPTEELYKYCYPPDPGSGYAVSPIAQEMIDRRREKQTLDALRDLVVHLDGLREERKAILLVSEGWLLYRESRALAEIVQPQMPGIGVGPTGRIGSADRNNPYGARQSDCDRDRLMLANLDNDRDFRDLLDVANRANASFYTIDPAGLRVFDTDIGPNPPASLEVDSAMLRNRITSLRVAADNTDGVAVINSNDIDRGLQRVVADLTSYYLFGYSSTNTKLDGRFRAIRVRVKRPGVEVRARRGYRAATEAEVAVRAAAPAPALSEEEAALERAVVSLGNLRTNAPFHLQVSPGWWTPSGPALPGKAAGPEPALWIFGEIDTKRPGGDDWSQGGQAEVAILSASGEVITSYRLPIEPGTNTVASRFPRSADDVWLDPGSYAVRVRVRPATGGLSTMDTARFELPPAAAPGSLAVGLPVYSRRGQATGNVVKQTADLRYRRTERIVVEVSATLAPEAVSGELLDRKGNPLALPVTASTGEKDGVVWMRAEAALAALAPGDYVLRLTAIRGSERRQVLAPFKVVP